MTLTEHKPTAATPSTSSESAPTSAPTAQPGRKTSHPAVTNNTNAAAASSASPNGHSPTAFGPHQRPRVFDPYNKNPYPHQPPSGPSSPFYFRLPRLTPQQLALINKYSGYGWAALIFAGGVGALMGYESKVIRGQSKDN